MSGTLLAVSHGTADADGQQRISGLTRAVAQEAARRKAAATVRLAHVDVQEPRVGEVLAGLPDDGPVVIVPVLLSAGYHVKVDLRRAAEQTGGRATVAPALGPDDRLVDVLEERLRTAGYVPGHHRLILGAAGSSDPGAVADCRRTAHALGARLGVDVADAYLSAAEPTVADAVADVRHESPGRPVMVASYLLAPGYFQTVLEAAGADVTTVPLLGGARGPAGSGSAPPPELVEIVLDRYLAAVPQSG